METILQYSEYANYILPIVMGLVFSWTIVRSIRLYNLEEKNKALASWKIRAIAFVLASTLTTASWWGMNGRSFNVLYDALIYGAVTGAISPAVWSLFIEFMRKRYPDASFFNTLHPYNKGKE